MEVVKEKFSHHIRYRLCIQSLFGGFEEAPHLAPGGNPMMSFVLATADRQAKGAWQSPQLSHTEFWGIEHQAEEE